MGSVFGRAIGFLRDEEAIRMAGAAGEGPEDCDYPAGHQRARPHSKLVCQWRLERGRGRADGKGHSDDDQVHEESMSGS